MDMSFPPSRIRGFLPDYDYWSRTRYHEAKSTEDKIYIRMLGLHPQDFYSSGFPVTSLRRRFPCLLRYRMRGGMW